MVATCRNPVALLRQALSALLLAVAILCALPSADAPAIKRLGSAFSADTADMAVLPTRLAARAIAAPAAPEPILPPVPVLQVASALLPLTVRVPAQWPQSRAPPPSASPGPVARPRAPPVA